MTSAFDLRAAAGWLRLVAHAEAVSWVGLLVGIALNWTVGTWLLASLASVVPLCSVIFLIGADRTGRMGTANASTRGPATRPIDTGNDVTDLGA